MAENIYIYEYKDGLYFNLTNRCTNACDFCIRNEPSGVRGTGSLWLDEEPDAAEVIAVLDGYDLSAYSEAIFCGYGEPTMRLDVLCEVARELKRRAPQLPVRINTNGQANLYYGEDVTGKLVGIIDVVSVSLNAPSANVYSALCHSDYGRDAFPGILEFAQLCRDKGISVAFTVVDTIGQENIEACQKLSYDMGIPLRVRHYNEDV